jgi:hypothetical protein
MFRKIRIAILLFILASVAVGAWRTKAHAVEWKSTLPVIIYPINGDGSQVAESFLRKLTVDDFKPIENFMHDEAARYGRELNSSIEIRLGEKIASQPPSPPRNGNALEAIVWSLKMRWWAYRNTHQEGPGVQVKMFVLYFDPQQNQRLSHSTGLQQGLVGRVNVFAARDMAKQNNVIIAHEFLHTLGATDKYEAATNQPVFPDGYAEPNLTPLLPQHFAEIMAGRTPLSESTAETPRSLDAALIGSKTAQEINWR